MSSHRHAPTRLRLLPVAFAVALLMPFDTADAEDSIVVTPADLPRVTTTIGPVEIGLRYRVSESQTEKVTTVTTRDYKQLKTMSYDNEFKSTRDTLRKITTTVEDNLKIGWTKDFTLSGGVDLKDEETLTNQSTYTDDYKLHLQDDLLTQVNQQSTREVIESTKLEFTDGFVRAELLFRNFYSKVVKLSNINVAIVSSRGIAGAEETLATFVLGIQTTSIPGGDLGTQPLTLEVPPLGPGGEPFRQVVYLEKLPTGLVKQYLAEGRIFHLEINSITYTVGTAVTPVAETVAALQHDNVTVNIVAEDFDDRVEYIKTKKANGEATTLVDIVKALDGDAVVGGQGADRYIQKLDGRETSFRSWRRGATDEQFKTALPTAGAWVVTIVSPRADQSSAATFDTPLAPGDRVLLSFVRKQDLFASAYNEAIAAGTPGRSCAVDKTPAPVTQVCFRGVKPGDILRIEGRAWRAHPVVEQWDTAKTADFFATYVPPPIACGATLPHTCPAPTPTEQAFIRNNLTGAKATFSFAKPVTGWTPPGEVQFSVHIGNNGGDSTPVPLATESYPDGWFAFTFLMPALFGSDSLPVCFREQPAPQTLTYGRALNLTPSDLNNACPPSGCSPAHRWLLDWKSKNPSQEKKVYEAKIYQLMSRHLKTVSSNADYDAQPQHLGPDMIKKFRNWTLSSRADATAPLEETCPSIPFANVPPYP